MNGTRSRIKVTINRTTTQIPSIGRAARLTASNDTRPIAQMVNAVLDGELEPRAASERLMRRQLTSENE